ncbi:hypothetical protein [Deinococcus hopiensis]|uniref:hypothetical protein n=1 Tax=Deinococcus hopiensis TaxID=309885 RepID=UPI001BAEA49C|nr:hypothetical protein [Deinococcus hopiensis]
MKYRSAHLRRQLTARGVPTDLLQDFGADAWDPVMAEVRTDTGKFVRTTWTCEVDGRRWWVVIGFGDTVEQVLSGKEVGPEDAVTEGPLYRFVREVNGALMDEED